MSLCECGCGETTTIIRYASQGVVGQSRRFRRGHYQRTSHLPLEERERSIRERNRRSDLKRNYGMTVAEWEELYESQGGCCAICGTDKCVTGKRLAVDHDHETGRVRGLLCTSCNNALGRIERSAIGANEWFARARAYLIPKGI